MGASMYSTTYFRNRPCMHTHINTFFCMGITWAWMKVNKSCFSQPSRYTWTNKCLLAFSFYFYLYFLFHSWCYRSFPLYISICFSLLYNLGECHICMDYFKYLGFIFRQMCLLVWFIPLFLVLHLSFACIKCVCRIQHNKPKACK